MGADLFESYVGSIIASITLGVLTGLKFGAIYPLTISAVGIFAAIVGSMFVKGDEKTDPHKALKNSTYVAGIIVIIAAFLFSKMMFQNFDAAICIAVGLVAGILIGYVTEIYTSADFSHVKKIAQQSITGPATTIISGLAVGMYSTALPIIFISMAILLSYHFGGLYGIALAAVGMLRQLVIQLLLMLTGLLQIMQVVLQKCVNYLKKFVELQIN